MTYISCLNILHHFSLNEEVKHESKSSSHYSCEPVYKLCFRSPKNEISKQNQKETGQQLKIGDFPVMT